MDIAIDRVTDATYDTCNDPNPLENDTMAKASPKTKPSGRPKGRPPANPGQLSQGRSTTGITLRLPRDVGDRLETELSRASRQVGLKVSRSQAVVQAIVEWLDKRASVK